MDTAALDLASLTNISGWSIVALVVVSIIRGWLVPRPTLRDRMADKEDVIVALRKEKDDWKAADQADQATIKILTEQLRVAMKAGELATEIVTSLKEAVKDKA